MPVEAGECAVVVGAGMGGLAAAAALAPHFARVVVLERDALPVDAVPRPGTPQSRQVHGLLGGGLQALKDLLPAFEEALVSAGAVRTVMGLDARLEQPGFDPFPQRDLGRHGYSMSRPLLESVVRQRVRQFANVEVIDQSRVLRFRPSKAGALNSVQYEREGHEFYLDTDLVIDASGRGALTLDFLVAAGFETPEEAGIGIDVRYTTGVFSIPKDATRDWKILQSRPDPRVNGCRAIMFPLEGGERWILGLGGTHGDSAPDDLPGYIDYARRLRTATAYEAIRHAEPQGDLRRFAFPSSVRRYFEQLSRFPRGLLPIGDAICRINPSFGQGMSVAAKEAVLLRNALAASAGCPDPLANACAIYFAELGTLLEDPWAAGVLDFVYPQTRGVRPEDFAQRLKLQGAIARLAARDPEIHRLMLEVSNLITPSSVFREPGMVDAIDREMAAAPA